MTLPKVPGAGTVAATACRSWWPACPQPRVTEADSTREDVGLATEEHDRVGRGVAGDGGEASARGCSRGDGWDPGPVLPYPRVPEHAVAVQRGSTEEQDAAGGRVGGHGRSVAWGWSRRGDQRDPIGPVPGPGVVGLAVQGVA